MSGWLARLAGRVGSDSDEDPAALRAEIARLRARNERMKAAMRHCIDCEYRREVLAQRAELGRTASGHARGETPAPPARPSQTRTS